MPLARELKFGPALCQQALTVERDGWSMTESKWLGFSHGTVLQDTDLFLRISFLLFID